MLVDGTGEGDRGFKAPMRVKGDRPTEVYEAKSEARIKELEQQVETLAKVQHKPRAMVSS
jgi:hypothetical protein